MRFLVDECTGPRVAAWLSNEGHEVFSVYDQFRGATDEWIIQKAFIEDWILITNDKDFGEKAFRDKAPFKSVILLRLNDERSQNKIRVLSRLLESYSEQLPGKFSVVTEKQVRFAVSK